MHQIQLTEQVYLEVQKAAAARGFETVEAYIADVAHEDLEEDEFTHLFTPERLAKIDKARADVQAGNVLSKEQVEAQDRKSVV